MVMYFKVCKGKSFFYHCKYFDKKNQQYNLLHMTFYASFSFFELFFIDKMS